MCKEGGLSRVLDVLFAVGEQSVVNHSQYVQHVDRQNI